MLKKRVIALVPLKGGVVVQSIGFKRYLPIGSLSVVVEYLSKWGIDELVIVDLDATKERRAFDTDTIRKISKFCFVPLTIGGGIRNNEDIKKIINSGADKVSINSSGIADSRIISSAAKVFGSQSIIAAIDVCRDRRGEYKVFEHFSGSLLSNDPIEHARKMEKCGAGEIFLNFVERDGMKSGYELSYSGQLARSVDIPVILCGGAGHPSHFIEGLNVDNVSAVAAGNYFHYTEHSVITTKRYIRQYSSHIIRLDSYSNYTDATFDEHGRLESKSEQYLNKIHFEYISKEII